MFLSHATEDSVAANKLASLLTKLGLRVFIAEQHINARVGSQAWGEAIDDALDASTAVLLLVSPSALASEWVKYEWRSVHEDILAKRGGMLVPVCWQGPGPEQLPRALRRHQCVDCRVGAWSEPQLKQIEALLHGGLKGTTQVRVPQGVAASSGKIDAAAPTEKGPASSASWYGVAHPRRLRGAHVVTGFWAILLGGVGLYFGLAARSGTYDEIGRTPAPWAPLGVDVPAPAPTVVEPAAKAEQPEPPEASNDGKAGAQDNASSSAAQPTPVGDRATASGKKPPPRAAEAATPFDLVAAKNALNAAATNTSSCGGTSGAGRMQLTFAPSGKVYSAQLIEGLFAGTGAGQCALKHFKAARVPAFSGPPQTVMKSFHIP